MNEYRDKIIQLEKDKDYRGAYAVLKEALTVYPTQPFLLRTEVFLLWRLRKLNEARQKADEKFDELKSDPFFLKTYLLILDQEKTLGDLENLLMRIPSWKIYDEDFYKFAANLTKKHFGKERGIQFLRNVLLTLPGSNLLQSLLQEWESSDTIEHKFQDYKERFKGKEREAVIREIEAIKAIPQYKDDADLDLYLAENYKKAGRFNEAIKVYLSLLAKKDHPFTRKMLGYAYYKIHESQKASTYLSDIFLDDPFDYYLYGTITRIFEQKKDFEGYQRLLQQALAKHPEAKHLYGLLKKAKQWTLS